VIHYHYPMTTTTVPTAAWALKSGDLVSGFGRLTRVLVGANIVRIEAGQKYVLVARGRNFRVVRPR
jgi:hypothetical protein